MSSPTFLGAYPITKREESAHHTERTNLRGKSSGRSAFTTNSTQINYTTVRTMKMTLERRDGTQKREKNLLIVAGPAGAGGAISIYTP